MLPTIQKITLDGASRHRLLKGFILTRGNGVLEDTTVADQVVARTNATLNQYEQLADFSVIRTGSHPSVIAIKSPFHYVYSQEQRDMFIEKFVQSTQIMMNAARNTNCVVIASGVNPYFGESSEPPSGLCADIHQIEIFDDGEVERIYNLFRQFLPELLAISVHASVYGGVLQKDFSLRMRVNPASFLPRYISQFSVEHLRKLERMMRKEYGLRDLREMDINPIVGKLSAEIVDKERPAIELRFVDSQCSYAFIRAQIILFQAIAIYGRSLARKGKRLPYMRDEVIDENKALAIRTGASAVLKPDSKFMKSDNRHGFWYHDRGESERATNAILAVMNGLLLPALQELRSDVSELMPIVLGAELRQRGKRCLANYAEFQQYIFYTYTNRFPQTYQQQMESMLSSSNVDAITNYNQQAYTEVFNEISEEWQDKLTLKPRLNGKVKTFDSRKKVGYLTSLDGVDYTVFAGDVEGVNQLESGQNVTFEVGKRRGKNMALRVRIALHTGQVNQFDNQRQFGFIVDDLGERFFVHISDVSNRKTLFKGDIVTFESVQGEKGLRAIYVRVQDSKSSGTRLQGTVKWFDLNKRMGYIVNQDGEDIFVHQTGLDGVRELAKDQIVSFEVEQTGRGPKAILVRVEK